MHTNAFRRHWNDTASWDEQFAGTRLVTSLTGRLAEIAPETGAYLNEVSLALPFLPAPYP